MIVGCYSLHLYCDFCEGNRNGNPADFSCGGTADSGAEARKEARAAGWRLFNSGHCACPACVKKYSTAQVRAMLEKQDASDAPSE